MSLSEAQQGLLRDLPGRVSLERIERIWLFSPREIGGRESGLVVLSLLPAGARPEDLRQVVTLRYEAERARGRLQRGDLLAEEGWAPADRISRVIEGVLARLGDESENPRHEEILGSAERWAAFLGSVGVPLVDSSGGE